MHYLTFIHHSIQYKSCGRGKYGNITSTQENSMSKENQVKRLCGNTFTQEILYQTLLQSPHK